MKQKLMIRVNMRGKSPQKQDINTTCFLPTKLSQSLNKGTPTSNKSKFGTKKIPNGENDETG